MKPASEQTILCSRTSDLPPSWLPQFGAIAMSAEEMFEALNAVEPCWVSRDLAEGDSGFKQWIPYALLTNPPGAWAAYPRQGTENRLHGLWSLGIGGHVNPPDLPAPVSGTERSRIWRQALEAGLRRELAEEFPGLRASVPRFLGLIHESRTTVGQVHLGAVYCCRCQPNPGLPGPELEGLQWLPRNEIVGSSWPLERFELWSQLALQLVVERP